MFNKNGILGFSGKHLGSGLLGLIISSIAINNAKKLKDQNKTEGKSMWFLVVMLIIFIAIICGASIYGLGLYVTEQKGETDAGTPKGVEKYYSQFVPQLRSQGGGECPHHS